MLILPLQAMNCVLVVDIFFFSVLFFEKKKIISVTIAKQKGLPTKKTYFFWRETKKIVEERWRKAADGRPQ